MPCAASCKQCGENAGSKASMPAVTPVSSVRKIGFCRVETDFCRAETDFCPAETELKQGNNISYEDLEEK